MPRPAPDCADQTAAVACAASFGGVEREESPAHRWLVGRRPVAGRRLRRLPDHLGAALHDQPACESASDVLPRPQSRVVHDDRHRGRYDHRSPFRQARGGRPRETGRRLCVRRAGNRGREEVRPHQARAPGADHLRRAARFLRFAGRVPAVRLAVVRGPVPDQPDVRHAGAARELPADVARREEREDRAQLRRAAAGDGRQARCAHRGNAAAVGGGRRAAVGAARALAGRDRRHDRAVARGKPARHELRRAHGEGRGARRHVAHVVARRGDRGRPDQRLPGVRADARGADRRASEGGGRGGRCRPVTGRRGLLPGDAAAVHDQRLHARAGARARARRSGAHRRRDGRVAEEPGAGVGHRGRTHGRAAHGPAVPVREHRDGARAGAGPLPRDPRRHRVADARVLQDDPARQARGRADSGLGREGLGDGLLQSGGARWLAARHLFCEPARHLGDADLGHEDPRGPRRASPAITSRSRWRAS